MAEAWLIAQDPYLKSDEFGQSIDEVENLIKKHEAFEKAAAAQEERFAALERLTTVSRFNISLNRPNLKLGKWDMEFYDLSPSVRVERYEETTGGGAAGPCRYYREAEGREVKDQILTQHLV